MNKLILRIYAVLPLLPELRVITVISLFLVPLLCGDIWAEDFESVSKKAAAGDIEAQYALALMFYKGEGVERDYEKSAIWYRVAAEQGDVYSQYFLGLMYINGRGVISDLSQAFKWHEKAAKQGYVEAQYSVAMMYRNGKGVKKDLKSSFLWYRRAAEQGEPYSQLRLGKLFGDGLGGVSRDYPKAAYWYGKAAESGMAEAANRLGNLFSAGKGVDKDLETAVDWFFKSGLLYLKKGDEKGLHAAVNDIRALVSSHSKADKLLKMYSVNKRYIEGM